MPQQKLAGGWGRGARQGKQWERPGLHHHHRRHHHHHHYYYHYCYRCRYHYHYVLLLLLLTIFARKMFPRSLRVSPVMGGLGWDGFGQSFGLEGGSGAHLPQEIRQSQGDPLPQGAPRSSPPAPPRLPSRLLTAALPGMSEPLFGLSLHRLCGKQPAF